MHAPPGKINYSWRITIFLFTIEHLLEIFETRKMYPLGISLLTFMQLSAAYVVGRTETSRSTPSPLRHTAAVRDHPATRSEWRTTVESVTVEGTGRQRRGYS